MQRALRDQMDSNARTDGQCKQRDGNPKKEPKRNVRDKKR